MKPLVKESEKSRILKSKDYSMFEFPDFKVSKKHLERMKESIQSFGNLCPDEPIVVDPKTYKIIKGRYRFLACYDLQLPIHYKISEVTTEKNAVATKHIHKQIAVEDVVKLYADLKPYNDILVLHDELSGYFSLNFIPYAIPEARAKNPTAHAKCILKMDRETFNSGCLPEWNYNKTRARLLRVKNFCERFHEFGWSKKDAFCFVDTSAFTFNDVIMKRTADFMRHLAKRDGYAGHSMPYLYSYLDDAMEAFHDNRTLYAGQVEALQFIGVDVSRYKLMPDSNRNARLYGRSYTINA